MKIANKNRLTYSIDDNSFDFWHGMHIKQFDSGSNKVSDTRGNH